jgi:hypothetical protein
MSDSRFISRGVGAAGTTSTAGSLRTVNFNPAVDVKNVAMRCVLVAYEVYNAHREIQCKEAPLVSCEANEEPRVAL